MALTINTNVMSLNAQRNLSTNQSQMAQSLQRLSSGLRVNSAKDDAAGMAIAETMTSAIRGSQQAIRNANDGISLAQTGEAAIAAITESVQRIREIAVQSSSDGIGDAERKLLQEEVDNLTTEINRIVNGTQFNGTQLLDGSGTDLSFQVGYRNDANDQITLSLSGINLGAKSGANGLNATGGAGTVDVSTQAAALEALDKMTSDLTTISTARSTYGAIQNRFEASVRSLDTYVESMSAARGRIIDADFAAETANLTRVQILQQAGTAMLAQANAMPQVALTLLQ